MLRCLYFNPSPWDGVLTESQFSLVGGGGISAILLQST